MLLGDYHTHTTYSRSGHGKGSVLDNARVASEKGLKELALTDHGFRHGAYGITKKAFPKFLTDVNEARSLYPDLKIFVGVEANFVSPKGDLDIPEEIADKLDIIVAGYHKFVRPTKGGMGFVLRNLITKNSRTALVKNTDAYLNALERYDIAVLSHPNSGCRIDLKAVGEQASKKGSYIELNGKRVSMTADELVMMASLGCKFLANSDAHTPDRIGEVDIWTETYKQSGLSADLVHNYNRLPQLLLNKR
ncbi:MAG: PHP domain-containing protein [Clostridia bacterium]|nr:PHP domain-containing protein [Clostridia bacterium]